MMLLKSEDLYPPTPCTSEVYTSKSHQGLAYVLRYPLTSENRKKVYDLAFSMGNCRTCAERACAYIRDVGPCGPLLFDNLSEQCFQASETMEKLRELSFQVCSGSDAGEPIPVVVHKNTYAGAAHGKREDGTSFFHWSIKPDQITEDEVATRFNALSDKYISCMDTRLSKLTQSEAIDSVKIMEEERPTLSRPGHWQSVIQWVQQVQTEAKGKCFDSQLSTLERASLRIFALMTGRVESSTHLDFHQSSNIVDFLTCSSREELRAEMDSRSNPATYQVSQLNRRLAAEKVTSKCLIGLSWPGEFKDDLDIHVITPSGCEIYYGNKRGDGCKLDFDANVGKPEAEPCENVSCREGEFTINVNNYTRRTKNKDIPFTIVCREVGQEDCVYECLYGPQQKGKMFVCTHRFKGGPYFDDKPLMSEKAASRAFAHARQWDEFFGQVSSEIASTKDLTAMAQSDPDSDADISFVELEVGQARHGNVRKASKGIQTRKPLRQSQNGGFLNLASNAAAPSKKKFLSENCRTQTGPNTMEQLLKSLEENPDQQVHISLRDFAPGYVVTTKTKTQVTKSNLALCHFAKKFELPTKPSKEAGALAGNARLDSSWIVPETVSRRGAHNPPMAAGMARVTAVVRIGTMYFCALAGARLPTSESSTFPLAGGFYPTDLRADFRQHRERWTYLNSQQPPKFNASKNLTGSLLIGTFITAQQATFHVDRKTIVINNN